jgi:hypothetical protein
MDGAAVFEGSGKLTDLFGYWPTFHDAEVHELLLDRGNVDPDGSSYVFPILTVKIHVFEMTNEVDSAGYFVLTKHTLVTLRFHDVEDCRLNGFNQQNAINGLTVAEADAGSRRLPLLGVRMDAAYGLDASFKCSKCEVLAAVPCDKKGRLLA